MIVAVYSVKGGAGRTTITVNMAAAIGNKHRGECVLLDLSLPYNHAALVANLVPKGCLALSERADQAQFEHTLLAAGLHHPTGMVVLPSALKLEQTELVTAPLVQRALDVRLLLRMGTKYALARATLLVAEFAVVAFILVRFVFPLVRHKENLPVAIPVLVLLGAGLIKLFASHDSISHRIQRWLDR